LCQAPRLGGIVKKYKLKTHKGTAKRIKFTGSSLALREHAARTKYRRKKRGEVVRGLKRQTAVAKSDMGNIRRLLPYG
jgi:large subunit ribosomal protein L35